MVDQSSGKLVSILTVTNRPDFVQWVSWNVQKQTYPNIEWIIINSSNKSINPEFKNVRLYNEIGHLSELRNIALSKVTGDYYAWMDDDDWQHPKKIETLVNEIRNFDIVGWGHGWFVDVETLHVKKYKNSYPIYINSLFHSDTKSLVKFDPKKIAADSRWMDMLLARCKYRMIFNDQLDVPCFWLRHGRNDTGNKIIGPKEKIGSVKSLVSEQDWIGTDENLKVLRDEF